MAWPSWHLAALRDSERVAARTVFFVAGCQKSGTTWLQKLLDAHPRVACGGEGHAGDLLAPLLRIAVEEYNRSPRATRPLSTEDLYAAVRLLFDRVLCAYLDRHADPDGVLAVGDKTPESAIAIDALNILYPDARIIHIIRDGRDAATSGWAHLAREGGGATRFASFAEYAEYFAGRHWAPYITAMRRWGAAWATRYHELRYEALHADAASETRRLLAFLGVEPDAAAVARCLDAASFERLSGGRARGEEDARSHYRKGIVGDWRDHFDPEAERRFHAAAGTMLESLGYVVTHAATPV